MRVLITNELKKIEAEYNVKILLAVESGSRAWGFASPDSDFDVRFIYIRPKEDYLRLEEVRDVIELPINDDLDINGWDLQKALRLLYRSNPTLFEWFSSPIVYMETDFADQFRGIMTEYFSTQKSLYHYISMAEGNYREFLKGEMKNCMVFDLRCNQGSAICIFEHYPFHRPVVALTTAGCEINLVAVCIDA